MKNILLITAFLFAGTFVKAQLITRGTQPGEIYLSRNWFLNSQNKIVYVVMRSTDNGEHLSLQYSSTEFPPQGTGLTIVSDATPGVLYGTNSNKLYISYDYANSWQFVENSLGSFYFSGNIEGEIFKQYEGIYLSNNFGQNFSILIDYVNLLLEIGNLQGELYGISLNYNNSKPDTIYYSENYSCNFIAKSVLHDTIAGYVLSGNYPKISRGVDAGEIYLITWHTPAHYRIYYSNDYGQTFELKYQSCYYELYSWGFHFTAGRQPGSFYVMRNTGTFEPYFHSQVCIDYSSDYAETFTTYFHDLDSNYVFYDGINQHKNMQTACYNFPNPFTDITTFYCPAGSIIEIFSLAGVKIYTKRALNNTTSIDLSFFNSGIYIYKISSQNNTITGKMMKK